MFDNNLIFKYKYSFAEWKSENHRESTELLSAVLHFVKFNAESLIIEVKLTY